MISKRDFKRLSEYLWEVPKSFRLDMQVPARIYASEKMLEDIFQDRSIKQLINGTTLPGIIKYAISMPDCHEGYSVPIGFVGAVRIPDGVISPGAVGFDISCGMRLLKSGYKEKEIHPYLEKIATEIQKEVPSGLGKGRKIKLSLEQINKILEGGARYLVEKGYGEGEDAENCEAGGRMEEADGSCVSERAKNRGRDQVGTLGSGNHFCEIQKVEEIFDEGIAEVFGLFKDQIVIMVHCGSRGLGHQVCTDYLRIMIPAMERYKIKMPEREFACIPFNSSEGQGYFKAMAAASNYAWANRQMIIHHIRIAWQRILGGEKNLKMLYDVSHNIAKIEEHKVNNEKIKVLVHRKGATRAFPPGHPEIPEKYRGVGQPVLIPSSMGTSSYVLAGTKEGEEAFFSTCHGSAAMRAISGQEVINQLNQKGIIVKCRSMKGIAEEAPLAYKDIEDVIEVVHQTRLSKKVARLVPLAVIKGE